MLSTINIPRVSITRHGYWDAQDVFMMVIISAGTVLIAGAGITGLGVIFDHHINPVRTVYKTKVVKENGLTTAQNAYIKQCEHNDEIDNNGGRNNGIPNVEVRPWTCTYAHQ